MELADAAAWRVRSQSRVILTAAGLPTRSPSRDSPGRPARSTSAAGSSTPTTCSFAGCVPREIARLRTRPTSQVPANTARSAPSCGRARLRRCRCGTRGVPEGAAGRRVRQPIESPPRPQPTSGCRSRPESALRWLASRPWRGRAGCRTPAGRGARSAEPPIRRR